MSFLRCRAGAPADRQRRSLVVEAKLAGCEQRPDDFLHGGRAILGSLGEIALDLGYLVGLRPTRDYADVKFVRQGVRIVELQQPVAESPGRRSEPIAQLPAV